MNKNIFLISGLKKIHTRTPKSKKLVCACSCFMDYHLKLGIVLSLLVGIIHSTHSSSYSSNSGSHRYITEAYFHKHNTIIDQVFQDFITNSLPHASCEMLQTKHNFIPKLSLLGRHLIGEGSHRRLTSSIKIKIHQETSSNLPSLSCKAILIERLPSGVFADPFELQHLTQRGVFTDASAFGDTDLELPTIRANRSIIEVHMDLIPKNKNDWELKIQLPLHARYAPLGEYGHTRIEFGSPDLFLHCTMEGDPHNKSCLISSTSDNDVTSNVASILWEVPSGIVKHTKVVSMITIISAVVSAFSIFISCLYYPNTESYTTFKQS